MTEPGTPPRAGTAKGAARRAAIVTAASGLLATQGPDALSHRSVAVAAGVPLAATTYYFASLEDLLVTAAERVAEEQLAAITAGLARLPRRRRSAAATAVVLADIVLGSDRRSDAALQALYEGYLACGRFPALRPVLRRSRQRIDDFLATALERSGHRAPAELVAIVDGTAISALVEGDGSARERVIEAVTAALSR